MAKNKDVFTTILEAVTVYLATHPHATEDAERKFWYYTEKYARRIADHALTQYRRTNA